MLCADLAATATAYPGSVDGLESGDLPTSIGFLAPDERVHVGAVAIPSNATVESGYIDVAGQPSDVALNRTILVHGQVQGTAPTPSHLTVRDQSLQLEAGGGAGVFQGPLFDSGTFEGTARQGSDVVSAQDDNVTRYTTPAFPPPGPSLGRLVADILPGGTGASTRIQLLNDTGAVIRDNLMPGDVLPTSPAGTPLYQLRVEFVKPAGQSSPRLRSLGSGFVVQETFRGAAAGELDGLWAYPDGLGVGQSYTNLTVHPGGPILAGQLDTYYEGGIRVGSMVTVGSQVWAFFSSTGSDGVIRIGRMVSDDGGWNWTVDANPLLSPSAGAWDHMIPEPPFAMRTGDGRWLMYYSGYHGTDAFGLAVSVDGISWNKYVGNPVLTSSTAGWDNGGVIGGVVVEAPDALYMYYGGRTTSDARKSLGVATSTDGYTWEKYTGNPVISRGSYAEGGYEVWPAPSLFANGVFYIYWSCASGSSAYDSCLSTSTDGYNMTFYNQNPVIRHGHGTWDAFSASRPASATDPTTGRLFLLFEGYGGGVRSVGRADATFGREGTYTRWWNLADEIPYKYTRHRAHVETPTGTSTEFTIGTALSRGSPVWETEAVTPDDTNIDLVPNAWLRDEVRLSTSSNLSTPKLHSLSVWYDRLYAEGTLYSPTLAVPSGARLLHIRGEADIPIRTSIRLDCPPWSNVTFMAGEPLSAWVAFDTFPVEINFTVTLIGESWRTPSVGSLNVSFSGEWAPEDIQVELEDGTPLAAHAGEMLATDRLELDTGPLNQLLAPHAGTAPVFELPVDLYVRSGSEGTVRVEAVRLNLSYPDRLGATFLPNTSLVLVEEGGTVPFRVEAWTTRGEPIRYVWSLDANVGIGASPAFTPDPSLLPLGDHILSVVVSPGPLSVSHNWTVRVLKVPPTLAVAFFPPVHELTLPAGSQQRFLVAAVSSLGDVSVSWAVDGSPAAGPAEGAYNMFDLLLPPYASFRTVTVTVTDGHDTAGWWWVVNATGGSAPVPLDVVFTPAVDVVMEVGDTQVFSGEVQQPAPGNATWRWVIDGRPVGERWSFTYRPDNASVGNHTVWAWVSASGQFAFHAWLVQVFGAPPPPPPPPPLVLTILEPADGTTTNESSVLVVVHAEGALWVRVGDVNATLAPDGNWTLEVPLQVGPNTITARAFGSGNRTASASVGLSYEPVVDGTPITTDTGLPVWLVLVIVGSGAAVALVAMRKRRKREENQGIRP